ncbi:hypothetical protein PGH42_14460 [Legionella pneumophila]|nr:hypothetical protein PGH42_14460 [Legionella pneumophila]
MDLGFPTFIYGTAWKEKRTSELVELALTTGFQGIDTANQRKHYYEEGVGYALQQYYKKSGILRDDIFCNPNSPMLMARIIANLTMIQQA